MKISIERCVHCGTLYKYGGYSIRSNEYWFPHCNDFCPECREAIWNTLQGIPRRFEPRWKEVTSEKSLEDVRSYIKLIKGRKALPDYDSGVFKTYPIDSVPSGMVSGEGVLYSRRKCALCKDESGNDHAFAWCEFDLEKGVFGEHPWECVMEDVVYPLQTPIGAPASDVYPTEIPKPNGVIFWLDMFSKLPVPEYPKYWGNGVWELDKGIICGKEMVDEVNEAILDECRLETEND